MKSHKTDYVAKSLFHKLWFCWTGQIGCTAKTQISVLANQPSAHSTKEKDGNSKIGLNHQVTMLLLLII